jgi:poly-gamma-glutamate synthesis protein (capsule biosynthesis protein)
MEENLKWIRGAAKQSDWVLVTLHSHEHGATREEPADFVKTFARACIDAGAHIFIGHGPHFLRGIEIYKGRPIFYSLGNFIFQNETIQWLPVEAYERFGLDWSAVPADFFETRSAGGTRGFPADPVYWRSVVAVCDLQGNQLREVRLYPIDLGYGRPTPQRGRPLLADPETGAEIIAHLQRLSRPFGTEIALKDGIGVITL